MNIGISGVAGVGKSELAEALVEKLPGHTVVDGYADDLEDYLDIRLGVSSTYLANWHVATEREKLERYLDNEGESFITVGTIIDTLAYAGCSAEYYANLPDTERNRQNMLKEMTAAQLLSFMLADVFRYRLLFYIPVPPNVILPGSDTPKFGHFARHLDEAIQTVIEKWGLPAIKLTGSLADKVEAVMKAVEAAKEPVSE